MRRRTMKTQEDLITPYTFVDGNEDYNSKKVPVEEVPDEQDIIGDFIEGENKQQMQALIQEFLTNFPLRAGVKKNRVNITAMPVATILKYGFCGISYSDEQICNALQISPEILDLEQYTFNIYLRQYARHCHLEPSKKGEDITQDFVPSKKQKYKSYLDYLDDFVAVNSDQPFAETLRPIVDELKAFDKSKNF